MILQHLREAISVPGENALFNVARFSESTGKKNLTDKIGKR